VLFLFLRYVTRRHFFFWSEARRTPFPARSPSPRLTSLMRALLVSSPLFFPCSLFHSLMRSFFLRPADLVAIHGLGASPIRLSVQAGRRYLYLSGFSRRLLPPFCFSHHPCRSWTRLSLSPSDFELPLFFQPPLPFFLADVLPALFFLVEIASSSSLSFFGSMDCPDLIDLRSSPFPVFPFPAPFSSVCFFCRSRQARTAARCQRAFRSFFSLEILYWATGPKWPCARMPTPSAPVHGCLPSS